MLRNFISHIHLAYSVLPHKERKSCSLSIFLSNNAAIVRTNLTPSVSFALLTTLVPLKEGQCFLISSNARTD